ncbi:MAG: Gfo/Idh/MocA family oxidoreductase [Opitutaceae bacterium]|jgi:predicted dehydrogenase
MKQLYSIGVIGAGMQGKVHIRSLRQDARAQVAWVCSASTATAQATASEFGIPRWTLDYRDVLADPSVDAVVIATPPHLHCQQLADALAAGKHVLVEKPLAVSPADAAKMVSVAAAALDSVVLEASCRHARLQPKYEFVRRFIESGKLGRVYHIHHQHLLRGTFIEYNPHGAWAMKKALAGGGPFIDFGAYDLSFHLGLLGDTPNLQTLRSFSINGLRDISSLVASTDVEQHGAAWLEFDDGLAYYYERGAGVHGETTCETRIHGTKGGLRFHYPSWESHTIEFFHDDGQPRRESFEIDMSQAVDDHVALARHFLDCLDGKAQPIMTVARAAKHLEILFRILAPRAGGE